MFITVQHLSNPMSDEDNYSGGDDNSSTDFGPDNSVDSRSESDNGLDFDDVSDDADGSNESTPHPRRVFTEVGTYATYEDARAAVETWNGLVYAYETRYETVRRHTRVFVCQSHVSCEHRLKMSSVVEGEESVVYRVSEAGEHGLRLTGVQRRGIHPQLREEIDSLLRIGWGGQELKNMLEHRYEGRPAMLAIIPTARQLTNRKAYLTRHAIGGWDLRNFATFHAWASTRMCTTRELFQDVTGPHDPKMDELIILDSFVFEEEDPAQPTSFGVVVTSRRVFFNVATSVRDQGRELVCSTDGTYKLHFGGWTVVDCGSVAVTWTRQTFTHRFIPWVYMFVRTESADAYRRMFEAVRTRARDFFDIEVVVAFGTLDHSEAIASAFEDVWPRIRLLTCWPHFMRQARKKRSLLSDPELFESTIKPHLQLLEAAGLYTCRIATSRRNRRAFT